MITATGVCKFCGQTAAIEVPERFTQEMIDEEVVKKCDCPEARIYTKQLEKIANGEGSVKDLFKDHEEMEVLRDIMISMVKPVIKGEISGASIGRFGYTGKIKPSKDGVKVTLEHKTSESRES